MGEHRKKKNQKFDLSVNPRLMVIGFIMILGLIIYLSPPHFGSDGSVGSTAPSMAVQPPRYVGMIDIEIWHRDALDMTKARQEGKDIVTTFYKQNSRGDFMLMSSGDFKGLHVNDYTLFFTVEPNSTDIYISPSHTADWKLNPRIQGFDFFDINNDGASEWVFEYDISGIGNKLTSTNPSFAISTMSVDEGTAILSTPSDIDVYPNNSINNIDWELIVPEKKGIAISSVSLIFDKPDSSLFDESDSYIKVPYIENLELHEMDKTVKSNEIVYSYEFDKDLGNSGYIFTNINENDHHKMPARIHTNISEGEDLGVTLEVRFVNPDRSFTSISDKVNIHATFDADPNTQKLGYEFGTDTEFSSVTYRWYLNSTGVNSTMNYKIDFEN